MSMNFFTLADYEGHCEKPIYSTLDPFKESDSPNTDDDHYNNVIPFKAQKSHTSHASREKLSMSGVSSSKNKKVCMIEGTLNTTKTNWYGFIANFSVDKESKLSYYFNYPHHMQIVNVIFYRDEELHRYANRNFLVFRFIFNKSFTNVK